MLEILYNRHTKVLNANVNEISKLSIVMDAVTRGNKRGEFTSLARSLTSILLMRARARVCVCVCVRVCVCVCVCARVCCDKSTGSKSVNLK